MKKIKKDIMNLAELSSFIAADNFKKVNFMLSKLKKNGINPVKIYETILQCYLFCGFPAAIESLKIFKKYFSEFVQSKSKYSISKFRKTGERNCKLIYKNNYKKLIENMIYYSPDLKEWMIVEGYGKVLGRSGLSLMEREYINVAILSTKYYEHQLHSHLRGCLNLGISKEELWSFLFKIKDLTGLSNFKKSVKLLELIRQKEANNVK